MQLRNLLRDDGAVSPVIGVILMVAITVILAAVIASFVLGLGGQTAVAPTAQFQFDYAKNDSTAGGNLTIQHAGGDTIAQSELFVRGTELNDTNYDQNAGPWNGTTSGNISNEAAAVSGDRHDLTFVNSTYEVNVVWEASEGDQSSTLASDSGPDA